MSETPITAQRSVKYLTFMLGEDNYGLEIQKVHEIMGVLGITSVPNTPDYIKGAVNIRGKVVPVVDLRLKFNMPEAEYTDQTCIIVVSVDTVEMGILVDQISDVMNIAGEDIEDTPEFDARVDTGSILGMCQVAGKVTILLDIDNLLTGSFSTQSL